MFQKVVSESCSFALVHVFAFLIFMKLLLLFVSYILCFLHDVKFYSSWTCIVRRPFCPLLHKTPTKTWVWPEFADVSQFRTGNVVLTILGNKCGHCKKDGWRQDARLSKCKKGRQRAGGFDTKSATTQPRNPAQWYARGNATGVIPRFVTHAKTLSRCALMLRFLGGTVEKIHWLGKIKSYEIRGCHIRFKTRLVS